jgi:hypothetical protein
MAGRDNKAVAARGFGHGIAEKIEREKNKKNPEGRPGTDDYCGQKVYAPGDEAKDGDTEQCQKNKFKRRAPGLPRVFHKNRLAVKTCTIQTNFKGQ